MIELPPYVAKILAQLNTAGYEAYIVGGCVRDSIMNIPPSDYDVTTSALPEQTKQVFCNERHIDTGIKHGTVSIIVDGSHVEITTYRIDGQYSDSRHPDSVSFTPSLREDLARRDFCCNAIAYSPLSGLIDPFEGQIDIEQRIIRAVGEPKRRFEEDALRILRGLRFASTLDFELDPNTLEAMRRCKQQLRMISGERIFVELSKMLCGKHIGSVIRETYDILDAVMPGLSAMHGFDQQNEHHCFDVLEHTIRVVENVPPEPELRMAALFHDIGKPYVFSVDTDGVGHFYGHAKQSCDMTNNFLNRCRCSIKTHDRIIKIIELHDAPLPSQENTMLRWINKMGEQRLRDLIAIHRADVISQSPKYIGRLSEIDKSEEILNRILENNLGISLQTLRIKGGKILELGAEPGPEVGLILAKLLDLVIDGELSNTTDDLEQKASELIQNNYQ